MTQKTAQLQIRVTVAQKALLKRRAAAAGLDVSTYVLTRVLPDVAARLEELLDGLAAEPAPRSDLAAFNALLGSLESKSFVDAVKFLDVSRLSPLLQNYLAAMVELTAQRLKVSPPDWTCDVPAIDEPYFAAQVPELKPYLLRVSPLPFKRRNLFVDSSVGSRPGSVNGL